MPKSDSLYDSF
ncbi:hypothetical protein AYI68_g7783, partial [Smittium mucronatum]